MRRAESRAILGILVRHMEDLRLHSITSMRVHVTGMFLVPHLEILRSSDMKCSERPSYCLPRYFSARLPILLAYHTYTHQHQPFIPSHLILSRHPSTRPPVRLDHRQQIRSSNGVIIARSSTYNHQQPPGRMAQRLTVRTPKTQKLKNPPPQKN